MRMVMIYLHHSEFQKTIHITEEIENESHPLPSISLKVKVLLAFYNRVFTTFVDFELSPNRKYKDTVSA